MTVRRPKRPAKGTAVPSQLTSWPMLPPCVSRSSPCPVGSSGCYRWRRTCWLARSCLGEGDPSGLRLVLLLVPRSSLQGHWQPGPASMCHHQSTSWGCHGLQTTSITNCQLVEPVDPCSAWTCQPVGGADPVGTDWLRDTFSAAVAPVILPPPPSAMEPVGHDTMMLRVAPLPAELTVALLVTTWAVAGP